MSACSSSVCLADWLSLTLLLLYVAYLSSSLSNNLVLSLNLLIFPPFLFLRLFPFPLPSSLTHTPPFARRNRRRRRSKGEWVSGSSSGPAIHVVMPRPGFLSLLTICFYCGLRKVCLCVCGFGCLVVLMSCSPG